MKKWLILFESGVEKLMWAEKCYLDTRGILRLTIETEMRGTIVLAEFKNVLGYIDPDEYKKVMAIHGDPNAKPEDEQNQKK